jgi:hypothetical protein
MTLFLLGRATLPFSFGRAQQPTQLRQRPTSTASCRRLLRRPSRPSVAHTAHWAPRWPVGPPPHPAHSAYKLHWLHRPLLFFSPMRTLCHTRHCCPPRAPVAARLAASPPQPTGQTDACKPLATPCKHLVPQYPPSSSQLHFSPSVLNSAVDAAPSKSVVSGELLVPLLLRVGCTFLLKCFN